MEWSPSSIGRQFFRLFDSHLSDQSINADDTIMATETSIEQAREHQHGAFAEEEATTVFYDGSCPLCSAEIAHYRRLDTYGRILFRDVSKADVVLEPELDRSTLMARLHVRRADGAFLSGAAAFVSLWRLLPRWRWVAYAAALPGATLLLEMVYRLFLPIRPVVSRLLRGQ